ncbi:MAG TPA: ABC transporter ATP-binding protein [Polyangiaceae bacterium]
MKTPSILRYYARELRRVLRRPGALLRFLLAAVMHAAGHALMALVAGGLAVALARAWGLRDGRSSPLGDGSSLADRAFLLAGIGLAVVVVKGAAGVYATYVQGRVAGEVGGSLRLALLDALLAVHRLRRPRHDDHGPPGPTPPTYAVAALTERVHEVELGLKLGLLGGARAVAQLLPLAVILVVLSPRMAAVAAVVLGGFGALLGRIRAGYQRATMLAARERELLLEAADEAVRHADLWVSYGAEAKARATVQRLGEALARGAARLEARATGLSSANEVLGAAALVLAVAASRAGWLGAVASGETLLAFAIAFFLAYRPLRELADARLALARASGAYAELARVLGRDAPPAPEARAHDWPQGTLELRELTLRHGGCRPLSIRVAPGSIVAIAGPTGIGKTTLLRTLLGLDPAKSGVILFDGASLDDAPAGPTARPFAWVPQDAPLLADTLDANVALGAPDADARDSLEPIGASHLARELNGVRLGAGGRAVSGGERQWISLARAIATRQPVLLLDEPTSGLDAEAQRRVLDAIARLRGLRTVLIVTHRPEPLAVADEVVHLEAA